MEPDRLEEPAVIDRTGRLRWSDAVLAGLFVGGWFLFFPRGIPWSSVTFFSAAVMGRVMPPEIPLWSAMLLHVLLAVCYSLIIALMTHKLRPELTILMGAATGAALYVVNWAAFYLIFDWWSGREFPVFIAHILFGAFAGPACRGLAGRNKRVTSNPSDD